MLGLQKLFDETIQSQFKPNVLAARIVESELEKIGIVITDNQRSDLERQFSKKKIRSINFEFNDDQIDVAGFKSKEELKPRLKIILDGLAESARSLSDKMNGTLHELVPDIVEKMAISAKSELHSRMQDMLEDQLRASQDFSNNIERLWGKPLALMQGLIVIAEEAAEGYLSWCKEGGDASITQEILLRIQAKSTQVSKEILALLRNGFADGAQGRWRTLHELSVVSAFIVQHGEGVALRYARHDAIELYKAAVQYNEFYARLGGEEISLEEMVAIKADYDELIELYGQNYKNDHGWAADALGIGRPTFRDIEASVSLDHYRPDYKSASANVHANPSGLFRRLGLFPEEDIYLAGPSNLGLSDPAQLTIISLTQITTSMLTHDPNIDFLVVCRTMAEYGKDVEAAFIEVACTISPQP